MKMYIISGKHGTQTTYMCTSCAAEAFPDGIGSEPYPTTVHDCDQTIDCEFCTPTVHDDSHGDHDPNYDY
jgi:hypothetical protein